MEPTATMTPDEAVFHLFFSAEALSDPAPLYRFLREEAPRHRSSVGSLVLTRFDDCHEVLRDNRFGKGQSPDGGGMLSMADAEAITVRTELAARRDRAPSMLFLNPPHHTRQRQLVARAFTPRRVEQMRASIAELARRCIDDLAEAGSGDLLDLVAFPLPVAVIGALVGVPETDWAGFRSLITTAAGGIEVAASAADLRAADQANQEVGRYFLDLIGQRRRDPKDDLLSDLLAVEEDGERLSEAEVVSVAALLFAAGFETTTNLIGNGMGALLRHPDQMARLWQDPALLPSAVDEMLRWDSPVQFDARTALEPADLFGHHIEEGGRVITLLGAANRDPEHFAEPDRFDVSRDDGAPMSFASGIHYCLGANLARAEGQEVFRALRDRFCAIELNGELRQRPRMTLRGYQSVPVTVTPR